VGSAAVQIAKLLGGRVIATAGSPERARRASELGADQAIDHTSEDLAARVRALTGKKGVEVVVEHVGGPLFEAAVGALARNGRLVTCGATIGQRATLDLNLLFGRHLSLLGSWMGRRADLVEALKFVSAGRLRPVVDLVLPLAEARQAHERIEARQMFGKVVLVP
jgi:NADPH:quinone reductase-like Zn-dependent oxidoreductase